MSRIIAILDYEINTLIADNKDVKVTYDDTIKYAKINYFTNGKYVPHVKGMKYQIHTDFKKCTYSIDKCINKIAFLPCAKYSFFDVLEIISLIQNCSFITTLKFHDYSYTIQEEYGMDSFCLITDAKDSSYLEFKSLYKKLDKLNFNKMHYTIETLAQSEIDNYLKTSKEFEDINPEALILAEELKKKMNNKK